MSRTNPTRTLTIERAWLREIRRRWARFAADVVARLRESVLIVNADGSPFVMSAEQQRVYLAYLNERIDEILLGAQVGVPGATNWQARYQFETYQRSLETTRAALIAQGASVQPTLAERLRAEGLQTFTATPSLATGRTFGVSVHQTALEFVQARAFDKLKGWTDQLAGDTRQILFDAVAEGRGIDATVRDFRKRIEVSRSRAYVIARTETNQAYSLAAITETRRASEEAGEDVLLRWISVRDSKVRHLHATFHGVVMTPDQAAYNKSRSPWNCRCGFAPVVPGADTKAKQAKFSAERTQLLEIERQGAA